MRVLVTGASGFVGRALVPALVAAGHQVRAAARDTARVAPSPSVEVHVHSSLAERVDWTQALRDVDAVVHLAGIAHTHGVSPELYDRVNRDASRDLAIASAAAGVRRLVFVSSIKAQSGATSQRVLTEADHPLPEDDYGRSKLAAEAAIAASGVPFAVLRPVLIYGPGAKGNLRSLARLASLPLPLPVGAVDARRSLLGVSNLCDAIELALREPRAAGEIFVAADPTPLSLPEIVAALREGAGRSPGTLRVPAWLLREPLRALGRGDLWDRIGGPLVVDPAKLLALGWQPRVGTRGGLADLTRVSTARCER